MQPRAFGCAPLRVRRDLVRLKLVREEAHHDVVVPGITDTRCFAFPAFDPEAAFLVGANSTFVIAHDPQSDPV